MLVNKVGDCALLAALVFSHLQFGTTSFSMLFDSIFLSTRSSELIVGNFTSISVLVLLLFIAVMAKSAQFGLHS
jgi:NADH:ubiquinone oxidoreductase subunit 5 (subunit L)/multisubunit Na+/H+ antiporter MnhA subunit